MVPRIFNLGSGRRWLYRISYHIISFTSIPWILTGLQNPYGYGNSHICL